MVELERGGWGVRATWHDVQADGRRIAIVCCPTCGVDAPLGAKAVSEDAQTTFICPQGCGFHQRVRFLGWADPQPAPGTGTA